MFSYCDEQKAVVDERMSLGTGYRKSGVRRKEKRNVHAVSRLRDSGGGRVNISRCPLALGYTCEFRSINIPDL